MTAVLQAHDRAQAEQRGELKELVLSELHQSPWNPRTQYDELKLKELAESLLAQGQLTPIVVRPRREGGYEIGAGHRRLRAAAQAGLRKLLAVVRPLDDVAFTELLNIENLQRDDLHPLEEAAGFKQLMERAGYDVQKIAVRIGRSTKYVYDRVKLLQLVPEARKMFLAGEFEAGHAIILARLTPAEQRRAIDKDNADWSTRKGGLFQAEGGHGGPEELALEDRVKAVSVREFRSWVEDNVRLVPERIDPVLFPQTAELLAQAKEEELKVVHITHDYRVPDAARDEKHRTYGEHAWKRADGKQKSRECDYAVLGVVVAGPGAGEAFRVCVRKDKCKVHWAAEQRQLVEDRKYRQRIATSSDAHNHDADREEARRQREQQDRERWKKATPALLEALAEKIKSAPTGPTGELGQTVLAECTPYGGAGALEKHVPVGRTADDVVRRAAFLAIANSFVSAYDMPARAARELKSFSIDAKKIVDQVAPPPKPEPSKKPAKKTTQKKRGARAARRS